MQADATVGVPGTDPDLRAAGIGSRPSLLLAPIATSASGPRPGRSILVLLTAVALVAAGLVAVRTPAAPIEPDLARVLRCMALIKGGFALAALVGAFLRLARPAGWRAAVYVVGPPSMAAGALCLFLLHGLGPAALALHLGLFATLAAALTDPDILPERALRRRT